MSQRVIVVGGGAAGAALACRLTRDPDVSVTLLEAGPDRRSDVVAAPARWPETLGGEFDYGYRTVPQAGLGGRSLDYHRGRVLGGTTCLNTMIHAFPRAEDLASWGPGWQAADLAAARMALESHRGGGAGRGTEGPAVNGVVAQPHELCSAFVDASTEAGHERIADLNATDRNGVGWFDLAIAPDGGRADAAEAYLRPHRNRPNLLIRPDRGVERLVIENGTVRSLLVRAADGGLDEEPVDDAEVILCGGAIDSPVLLLRSGVGPAGGLRAAGIPVEVDVPGVGENLQDHPLLPVVWSAATPLAPPSAQFFESQLVLRDEPRAGGQHLAVAFGHLPYLPPEVPAPAHGATALIGLYGPHSRGSLELDPDSPDGHPLIDPAFLRDDRDVAALQAGLEITREISAQPALKEFGLSEIVPGDAVDDLVGFVRHAAGTFLHPVGTCALGDGPDAVVDHDLRVKGLTNLRVADASIIPRIPAVATSAAAQLIGWWLAEKLAG